MKFYCERILFDEPSKSYEAILDFENEDDLIILTNLLEFSYERSHQTLLILSNLKFKNYKGFRAGYWYELNDNFFRGFRIINNNLDNSRVKASLEYMLYEPLNVQQYRITSIFYQPEIDEIEFNQSKFYNDTDIQNNGLNNLHLIVRNVGCGNWNEIRSADFWLIYDLGGDIKFTDYEMQTIISQVNFTQNFIGVISHWDLDHYRAILDLSDSQLSFMGYILVPSKMPNTLQLKNTLARLISFNIPINIIKASPKTGRSIDLISQGTVGNIELFRSCDGSNINQSGIVLLIEGRNKLAILTGDHHYPQVYRSIFSTRRHKPYELVVPHHGGHAGKFELANWSTINLSSGALSTLSGRYKNLPQKKVHDFFIGTKGFQCTECSASDYSTTL